IPHFLVLLEFETFFDGILMRTRECSEDQITGIWVTWMYWQTGTFFNSRDDFVNVGEIQIWCNTLGIHVQCNRRHIDVTGTLTISEDTAFHTVSTSHDRQFRCCDATTTVVMTMYRNDHAVAALDIAVHPFNLIGIDVWT